MASSIIFMSRPRLFALSILILVTISTTRATTAGSSSWQDEPSHEFDDVDDDDGYDLGIWTSGGNGGVIERHPKNLAAKLQTTKADDDDTTTRSKRVKRGGSTSTSNSRSSRSNSNNNSSCAPNQYQCDNKQCISASYTCDGDPDCSDNSDEVKCSPCHESWFQCPSGRCARNSYGCAGLATTTRSTTPRPRRCSEDDFRCDNGQCILAAYKCDGDEDCRDKSDESEAHCSPGTSASKSTHWPPPTRPTTTTTMRPTTWSSVKTTSTVTSRRTTTPTTTTAPSTTSKRTVTRTTTTPAAPTVTTASTILERNPWLGGTSLKGGTRKVDGIELDPQTNSLTSLSFVNGALSSLLTAKLGRTESKVLDLFQSGMKSKTGECRWTAEDFQSWDRRLREIRRKLGVGNLTMDDPGFDVILASFNNKQKSKHLTEMASWTLSMLKAMENVAKFKRFGAESNFVLLKYAAYLRERIIWRQQEYSECKWTEQDEEKANEKAKAIFDHAIDDGFLMLSHYLESVGSKLDQFYPESLRNQFKQNMRFNKAIYSSLFAPIEEEDD